VGTLEGGTLAALDHWLEIGDLEASGEQSEEHACAAAAVEVADDAELVGERAREDADPDPLLDEGRRRAGWCEVLAVGLDGQLGRRRWRPRRVSRERRGCQGRRRKRHIRHRRR
jgi:hypothetical protein